LIPILEKSTFSMTIIHPVTFVVYPCQNLVPGPLFSVQEPVFVNFYFNVSR